MHYPQMPKYSQWKADAYQLFRAPVRPEVANVVDLFQKYDAATSPMAKRNMLMALSPALKTWQPAWGQAPFAWVALGEVVDRIVSNKWTPVYSQVLCLGLKFNVGNFDANNKVKYSGRLDDISDMEVRSTKLMRAIRAAFDALTPAENRSNVLKIFMAPEFYFRGLYGAYPPDVVSEIIPRMRNLGTQASMFKDWLFVFGTAITASIDARHYCHTCNNSTAIRFQPDPLHPGMTTAVCTRGAAHQVREEVHGATIDNVALIQRRNEEYLVAKEYVSHIDFRDYQVNIPLNPGGPRATVDVLPPEGARPRSAPMRTPSVPSSEGSHKPSKYADERMGGAIFSFDGITFGLEVCLDHVESGGRIQGQLVQILLIPSAGMDISFWKTVPHGITFNVDGLRAGPGGANPVDVRVYDGAGAPQPGRTVVAGAATGSVIISGPFNIPY